MAKESLDYRQQLDEQRQCKDSLVDDVSRKNNVLYYAELCILHTLRSLSMCEGLLPQPTGVLAYLLSLYLPPGAT